MNTINNLLLLFILGVLVSCGGDKAPTSALVNGEQPSQTFKWKLVTTWPKNYPGLGMGPENFATLVDKMSNGRLKIKVYGAGDLVPAMEAFDTVQQGTAEMSHGAAYYWKGKSPLAPFFAAVPFGFTAQEMNAWLYHGGGMELWQEIYAPFNLMPLAGGNTGVQMAGWFNKEINSLKDLKGLKMRIPGLGGDVLNRVGGTAVNLPGSELFTSLQTGVIDATEWVGPYNDLAFGLYKVAKYYYYPGWHEPGLTLEFTVNKTAFMSLPADLQTIVKTAARAVNQDMLDEFTAANNAALKTLVEKHDVKLRRLPDDVIRKLHKTSDQVLEEMAAASPQTQKIYDSFKEFRDNVRAWHEVSEKAYSEARDLEY